MSFLSGLVRQTFLMAASVLSILLYLIISKLKQLSYYVRPWSWQRKILRQKMEKANTYVEFVEAAERLDVFEGKDLWKLDPNSPLYHGDVIEKRLQQLREARARGDIDAFMVLLRENLVRSIGGLGNPRLYTECNVGTKQLIEDYILEISNHLQYICEHDIPGLRLQEKERFFANSRQAFGRSALLLSGGGSLGMYHFGVVKCLFETNMLPPVICGASIGALVTCLLGAKTDDEIRELFANPNAIDFSAFEGLKKGSARRKITRLLKFGIMMDVNVLQQFCKDNLPNMTLQEAFHKTRRIINVVLTHPPPGIPHLLNHITAPNVLLWSAACASCVQPGLYAPVDLFVKDFEGNIVQLNLSSRSAVKNQRSDLPMERISQLFNVDHFIVSQVNAHVVASVRATKSSSRFSLMHRLAMSLGREVHHRISQFLNLFSLPSQFAWFEFDFIKTPIGHITIVPDLSLATIKYALSNPSPKMFKYCIKAGERSTFHQLSIIQTRCKVEQTLHKCTVQVRQQLKEQDGQSDLSEVDTLSLNRYQSYMYECGDRERSVSVPSSGQISATASSPSVARRRVFTQEIDLDTPIESPKESIYVFPNPESSHSLTDMPSMMPRSPAEITKVAHRLRAPSVGRSAVPTTGRRIPARTRTPPPAISPLATPPPANSSHATPVPRGSTSSS